MNDLQIWTQRALVQLHKEARAGVPPSDQLLDDLTAEYVLNYVREREPYRVIEHALYQARNAIMPAHAANPD